MPRTQDDRTRAGTAQADMDLAAAISYEAESVSMLFGTTDRAEGLAAFRDRRSATFTGR
jgi:enoyl-CoA hydratase